MPIDTPVVSGLLSVGAIARRDIEKQDIRGVALGIFMYRENWRENFQCVAFWNGSCYSEEDLSSDLIGFYLAVNNFSNPKTDDETWNWLSQVCNFPANREDAKEWSLKVFKEYNNDPGFEQGWNEWGSPRLECNGDFCGDQNGSWPSEFQEISPELPSRDGSWWPYNQFLDGMAISSNIENVRFVIPGGWQWSLQ